MILGINILFLCLLLYFSFLYIRKSHAICKVRRLSISEKLERLNQIIAPFGFEYYLSQDIFTSRTDAWQKDYGYGRIYDRYVPFFHIIFDCEPVYFDYEGATWLLEFWKGQYGITTGAEIGIYKADGIVPRERRRSTLFQAAPSDRLPVFSFTLLRNNLPVCRRCQTHWWLTAFLPGVCSEPEMLTMKISITFPTETMCNAFLKGLIHTGYDCADIYVSGSSVFFTFSAPHDAHPDFWQRCHRHFVQYKNRFLIWIFYKCTRPFCHTLDRLLLLYEYLPFLFRHLLKVRRMGRKWRKCS